MKSLYFIAQAGLFGSCSTCASCTNTSYRRPSSALSALLTQPSPLPRLNARLSARQQSAGGCSEFAECWESLPKGGKKKSGSERSKFNPRCSICGARLQTIPPQGGGQEVFPPPDPRLLQKGGGWWQQLHTVPRLGTKTPWHRGKLPRQTVGHTSPSQ